MSVLPAHRVIPPLSARDSDIMSFDDGKLSVKTPPPEAPELADVPVLARTQDLLDADAVDGVYRAKMHVVNDAMQEIGMGRYQVRNIRHRLDDLSLSIRSGRCSRSRALATSPTRSGHYSRASYYLRP
jgi:hypothetical protein